MKYMLLIRGDESAAAHAAEGCGGWDTELRSRGILVGEGGLGWSAGQAASVRGTPGPAARYGTIEIRALWPQ